MATTYNRAIRKLVVGFGNLFNNITLVRYNPDETEQQRFIVPIAYAGKEKYVQRLAFDPDLDKKSAMSLPRMSYEMTGLDYDASRKQNTNFKTFAKTSVGVKSQYNPVPYNFDFSLYIYVRNIEDGTQIIEHILPFFTPDYTIKLNLIPEMGIVKEIPILLNKATHEIEYEGDRDSDTRMVIWTLNFTVKGFIFGQTSSTGLITRSITNILSDNKYGDVLASLGAGNGTYQEGETIYQGFSINTATATATVVSWSNNQLRITNIAGNFVSSAVVTGLTTNAQYNFGSFTVVPLEHAQIDITPNPSTANANSSYTYTTTITETDDDMISGDLMVQFGTEDLTTEIGAVDLLNNRNEQ